MGKAHPPYPREFKQTIVELARAGRSPDALAKEFKCSAQSIRMWSERTDADAGTRSDMLTTDEREELRKLRRENRQLKIEREILSKTAAWFARETGTIPNNSSDS